MQDFAMLRDAKVAVEPVFTKDGTKAMITVNEKYQHTFPSKSRVSQQLQLISTAELGERMTGGDYFFLGDELIDFRDVHYKKRGSFVHDDKAIQSLMDVIGYTDLTDRASRAAHRFQNRTSSGDTSLSKVWSKSEIEVPMFNGGGDFNSRLSFTWNPFQKDVKSVFELVRLICTNGMVGTTPFVNMNIPLVNRWEEHLDIANRQLQNKISNMMQKRLVEMNSERASVADLLILDRHITGRLDSKDINQDRAHKLANMYDIIDPAKHLMKYYKPDVLENKAIAAQLPSHLTVFDLWNMVTEVCTHFDPTKDSTDAGLQKLANQMVFDRSCASTQVSNLGNGINLSPFSSPSRAFFGEVSQTTH